VRLAVGHPSHPSFFRAQALELLHPDAAGRCDAAARSKRLYTGNDHRIKPLVTAILKHPAAPTVGRAW